MNRRAFYRHAEEATADVRPTLMGIVTLMFLLLFFLLSTSSGQRLGAVALRLGGVGDLAPLPHTGLLQTVSVSVGRSTVTIVADIASTDIAAAATSSERRTRTIPPRDGKPDFAAIDAIVVELHQIDPSQRRARIHADDTTTTEDLLALLDVVRGPAQAPAFPVITLAADE